MSHYIAAIDQGTTSSRFMVFNTSGALIAADQREHQQIYPHAGWVEHDPAQIWQRVQEVIVGALANSGLAPSDLAAVGVTNQRETTVVWNRVTGEPLCNAIVWQDTRTADLCQQLRGQGHEALFRAKTGLPVATYFSGPKLKWILDQVPGAAARARNGELLFGTIDSWMIWNLTGGVQGGVHITDASNASRTLLMNLETLDWDDDLLKMLDIPRQMLPMIRSSSDVYAAARGVLDGVPVASALGDQQAALFGQTCFAPGEAKNTYGTGCFMLMNTGQRMVPSVAGLLTTVAYQLGRARPVYALEGAIAVAGALIQWVRDNLGLIAQAADIEALARTVEDNGGVFFVPAFSGLFAPYWKSDARGVIVGLTGYANKGHIARAALEATAFQTREVLEAMNADAGMPLTALKVDGGMVRNELLMQFQADMLGVPVIRPTLTETTALGAAYAAGLAVGFWSGLDELRANWGQDKVWTPTMLASVREKYYHDWKRAVTRTFGWVE
ncbi:MAG: glycerol kinase GlpK [Deltaproteobacteria bacterium]|nr:glycerol kinase GlpK [Deltaproteobacteria bacterium]